MRFDPLCTAVPSVSVLAFATLEGRQRAGSDSLRQLRHCVVVSVGAVARSRAHQAKKTSPWWDIWVPTERSSGQGERELEPVPPTHLRAPSLRTHTLQNWRRPHLRR